jgi:hypothetical protein
MFGESHASKGDACQALRSNAEESEAAAQKFYEDFTADFGFVVRERTHQTRSSRCHRNSPISPQNDARVPT